MLEAVVGEKGRFEVCCDLSMPLLYFHFFIVIPLIWYRILLMSATADANRFATYFERIHGVGTVPCLFVPGRTFPVRTMFLEDAIEETAFVAEGDSRKNMRGESCHHLTILAAG